MRALKSEEFSIGSSYFIGLFLMGTELWILNQFVSFSKTILTKPIVGKYTPIFWENCQKNLIKRKNRRLCCFQNKYILNF